MEDVLVNPLAVFQHHPSLSEMKCYNVLTAEYADQLILEAKIVQGLCPNIFFKDLALSLPTEE